MPWGSHRGGVPCQVQPGGTRRGGYPHRGVPWQGGGAQVRYPPPARSAGGVPGRGVPRSGTPPSQVSRGGGYPAGGGGTQVRTTYGVLATRRAVCLLRSRRRTFLFKTIFSDICPDWIPHLHALSSACNGFLRFTSDVTTTGLIGSQYRNPSFFDPTYLQSYLQALMELGTTPARLSHTVFVKLVIVVL